VLDVPSLSRIEAEQRAALLDVEQYEIALDLTGTEGFSSHTTIDFRCRRPGAETFVDVKAVEVVSVTLNGRRLDPGSILDGRLRLPGLAADNRLVLDTRMAYSSDGEGLHRHVDPADGRTYLYAMSFLDAGPRWFASFDQPDLKARYRITVDAPEDWNVIGNGPATRSDTAAGRWVLDVTEPLSTYFVTLVAGPYHCVRAEHDGIVLGVHARASLASELEAEAPEILQVTRASFDRYHELFGIRYPFGEYHQAFVPDFNAGAMENPGCVTLRDQFVFRSTVTEGERGVRANTIAHEMAHMWFGDLVTMRWWDDLWLNESFAEYMAHRVCSEVTGYAAWSEFGISRKAWGYEADQAPSTHPVAGNGSDDAASALADFDGISYAKGASALRQLAAFLGDDIFFGGLRRYFTDHAFGNATFADLMAAWTSAGAEGLDRWAENWLRTSGLDTIAAWPVPDGVEVQIRRPEGTERPHTVHVLGVDRNGATVLDRPVTLTGQHLRLPLESAAGPGSELGDPVVLAVADGGDETWAKLRFGPLADGAEQSSVIDSDSDSGGSGSGSTATSDGWQAVERVLGTLSRPLARVAVINALRDAVRDAELDPAAALRAALLAARSEHDPLVVGALLRWSSQHLAGDFAPAHARAGRLAQVASTATDLLDTAAPASDGQLVAARALIQSSVDAAMLERWLDGTGLPPGLVVDAELRWAIVTRLAVLGAIDAARIDAELAADRSSSGVGHAARSRAALPDPAAKRSAWQLLAESDSTPAYELYATASGFFVAGQESLTDAYVPRFFTELPATASFRQGWALARTVLFGYPHSAAGEATLAMAEAALARADLAPGVRRSLVDGTDSLRRAVRSLARFGHALQPGSDGIGSAV
jgi:aminopeptidase N